jgi:hypothetical protein
MIFELLCDSEWRTLLEIVLDVSSNLQKRR